MLELQALLLVLSASSIHENLPVRTSRSEKLTIEESSVKIEPPIAHSGGSEVRQFGSLNWEVRKREPFNRSIDLFLWQLIK